MRTTLALLTVCLASSTFPASLWGQRQGDRMPLETLTGSAIVKGARPGLLHVAMEGGQEWLVSLPTEYQRFSYEATATTRWLQPRMPVRFEANVTMEKRKREIVLAEPLKSLTVTPLRPDVGMGIFPEQTNPMRNNLFAAPAENAKKKPAVPEPQEVPCVITGQLVENKEGKLRVAAGPVVVRAELAADAEITVQWYDAQWIRPGDRADISARYPAGRPGQAQGQQITVVASQVLDMEQRVARGRRRAEPEEEGDNQPAREEEAEKDEEQEARKPEQS